MQAISPVAAADLLGPVQEMLYKLEVWDGASWMNLGSLGGKNYLKRFSIKLGGAGASPDPVAGTWTAEVANEDGVFHPFHPSSSYAGLFCVGRKVRISVGAKYTGIPFHWQRLIGFMDAPTFNHAAKTVTLKGTDFMKRLADTDLRSPTNYWGDSIVLSTIATTENFGPELYGNVDSVHIDPEIDDMSSWTAEDPTRLTSEEETGGGSTYVAQLTKVIGVYSHTCYVDAVAVTQGKLYKVTFAYRRLTGTDDFTEFQLRIYSGATELMGSFIGKSWEWETATFYFTATSTGVARVWVRAYDITTAACSVQWDVISVREVESYSNTRYNLPEDCNGVYLAVLDGTPIWYGQEKDGWLYDEENKIFYFVDSKMIQAGVDNLVIYYYTDQDLDDVLADLLVASGNYADRAAALAAMDYVATGITLGRVWFEAGTKALAAVKLICERANYRFWFAYNGTPCFKPAPEATSPVFSFTSPAHVQDPGVHQDLGEIRNRIVIKGIEQALYGTREDRQPSRLAGEDSDEDSIAAYLEKTHSITNHLFQDQASIDAMTAALLAAFKDPKWYTEIKTSFNPVPLELGDTIAWPVELAVTAAPGEEPTIVELTGIVRDIETSGGEISYKCEITTAGGMEAHALLSSLHVDTEAAAPALGDMVLASGEEAAETAEADPEHELLSEMHTDTVPASPLAADVIAASGEPVRWRRLPAGSEGQVLRIMGGAPAWADHSVGFRVQGRYYGSVGSHNSLTTSVWAPPYLRAAPFIVTRPTTFDRIGLSIASGSGTGRYMRLGIYANKAGNYAYPGALILDSGPIEVTSNTFLEANIDVTLQPGLYWLAFLQSYQLTIRVCSPASGGSAICGAVDGVSAYGAYFTVSQDYGALPDPYPDGASVSSSTNTAPYILLRVA